MMIKVNIPDRPIVFIDDAMAHLNAHKGINLTELARQGGYTKSKNKGRVGEAVQILLGLPNSNQTIDAWGFELKTVLGKRDKNGDICSSSEVAVTMLDAEEVEYMPFKKSRFFRKIQTILLVITERINGEAYLAEAHIIRYKDLPKMAQKQLESDYDEMSYVLGKSGSIHSLSGSMGVCSMPKTKGRGRGAPKTRAFYLRRDFINFAIGKMKYEKIVERAKERWTRKPALANTEKTRQYCQHADLHP